MTVTLAVALFALLTIAHMEQLPLSFLMKAKRKSHPIVDDVNSIVIIVYDIKVKCYRIYSYQLRLLIEQ